MSGGGGTVGWYPATTTRRALGRTCAHAGAMNRSSCDCISPRLSVLAAPANRAQHVNSCWCLHELLGAPRHGLPSQPAPAPPLLLLRLLLRTTLSAPSSQGAPSRCTSRPQKRALLAHAPAPGGTTHPAGMRHSSAPLCRSYQPNACTCACAHSGISGACACDCQRAADPGPGPGPGPGDLSSRPRTMPCWFRIAPHGAAQPMMASSSSCGKSCRARPGRRTRTLAAPAAGFRPPAAPDRDSPSHC